MKTVKTYLIDEARYQTAGHDVLLETIQYAAGDDIFTKQVIGAKMKEKLSSFSQPGPQLPDAFYFTEKRRKKEKKLISQAAFEARLSAPGAAELLHETLEELPCAHGTDERSAIVVVITRDNGGRKVRIEFASAEQQARFAPPDWLIPPEEK